MMRLLYLVAFGVQYRIQYRTGTNPDYPNDLFGEVEMFLNGEKHLLTKSCLTFIPAGLEHGPIRMTRMDRPILHFCCGTTKKQV